ncbi:MAG TPA: hypothetical protein VJW23_03155 [Propionibacteriaceae bacterium]|nr:hypothetical protein [Propionibacteriaceae bacterium]
MKPLPKPGDLVEVGAFGAAADNAVARIAGMISADPVGVRTRLVELPNVSTHEELNRTISEHEGELHYGSCCSCGCGWLAGVGAGPQTQPTTVEAARM